MTYGIWVTTILGTEPGHWYLLQDEPYVWDTESLAKDYRQRLVEMHGLSHVYQVRPYNPSSMTLNDYQDYAKRTSPQKDQREALLNFGLGITGEAGEVADHIKKACFHQHELDREHLTKELGDVLWYLAMLADQIGVSLDAVAQANVEKLKKRYPDGFSAEASKNRKE